MNGKTNVKIDPVAELLAAKLSGIGGVPALEQHRMVMRAAHAAEKHYEDRIAQLERRNELLLAFGAATIELYEYP